MQECEADGSDGTHAEVKFWLGLVAALATGYVIAATSDLTFREPLQPHDLVTMVAVSGSQMQFCWKKEPVCPAGTTCVDPYNVQFRRYRAEDGAEEMLPLLHVSEWKPSGNLNEWCQSQTVPAPGHWIYEARFCGPPAQGSTEPRCNLRRSVYVTDSTVDGLGHRPWWIYSYTPRPGAAPQWPTNVEIISAGT